MTNTKLPISDKGGKKRTSTFNVTFRARENNANLSINVRLSYDGKTFDKFTGVKCQKGEFKNGKIKGKPEQNSLLKTYENNLHKAFIQLLESGQTIDLERISFSIFGKSVIQEKPKLFEAIDLYIKDIYLDKGNDFADKTKDKNQRYGKHLKQWLKFVFEREGIDLTEIKPAHDLEIIKFMKSHRQSGHNHATRYVKWLKRFFDYAISKEWVLRNPFLNFKPKHEKVKIKYLTKEDIEKFEALKVSKGSTYERVRDFFLFSCYTGLSYIDLVNVTFNHIKVNENGVKYLEVPRQKTDVTSIVPLLEKPIFLIEKYRFEDNQVKIFNVPTNQCMNRTLKELAEMANLSIMPTFHISRKTCATLLISEGIDATIVQRVLGHSSLSTTLNHYGKIEAKPIIDSFNRTFKNA
ncbi:site-specific integrase [Arcicella rosea]|uniref:Site-specific recombinase XerD n=1 Tax=Arcicella rosea TaxID=502909 RepID=A0A841EVP9_9BACT|nr:site-specific integrase [Arcicella rosea]MBB6005133.1 site-specific recombinase XerD [Arcicella rosea]